MNKAPGINFEFDFDFFLFIFLLFLLYKKGSSSNELFCSVLNIDRPVELSG